MISEQRHWPHTGIRYIQRLASIAWLQKELVSKRHAGLLAHSDMILTGLYPNRTGIMAWMDSRLDPDKNNRLPFHIKTLGHMFQEAGYATAIAGKWHLVIFNDIPTSPPATASMSTFPSSTDGARRYYGPHNWENGEYRAHSKECGPTSTAISFDFIERNRELPFFAYSMNLIHGPLIEPPALQELAASSFPDDLGAKEQTIGHMITYVMPLSVGC